MLFYDELSKIHLLRVILTVLYDAWYDSGVFTWPETLNSARMSFLFMPVFKPLKKVSKLQILPQFTVKTLLYEVWLRLNAHYSLILSAKSTAIA
jgi:hypothetical protein